MLIYQTDQLNKSGFERLKGHTLYVALALNLKSCPLIMVSYIQSTAHLLHSSTYVYLYTHTLHMPYHDTLHMTCCIHVYMWLGMLASNQILQNPLFCLPYKESWPVPCMSTQCGPHSSATTIHELLIQHTCTCTHATSTSHLLKL